MKSMMELNLEPKKGKKYWKNCHREWREEFIYFLLVDRFHDAKARNPESGSRRLSGFGTAEQLQKVCGGTIRGIINHLDYIHDLGCTALWLSPVFENNPQSYHGYAIQNYFEIDRRFGTKEDLAKLVDAAHSMDMRVFLDVVIHHSGDNWFYPGDLPYYYYQGAVFPFGGWRREDRPIPLELRDPDLYGRRGRIRNFEAIPETREGDFMDLKTFLLDDSPRSLWVQDVLLKIHCHWIKEADVDGFRLDAVKHMSEIATSRFCSGIREYAYKLGKKNFFIFGEIVGPDEMYCNYIGPKTSVSVSGKTIYYGLNSVLDFPMHDILPDFILGRSSPTRLIERYAKLQEHALHHGEFGEYLVTFLDNHDQVGQMLKQRFGAQANEQQIIAGVAFLLFALGTPCIYYGTEQGFNGAGKGDHFIREAMFNLSDEKTNALNKESSLYKAIAKIAGIRKKSRVVKFGRMYIRPVSKNEEHFRLPSCSGCLLAFSRILFDEEILVAYNTSPTETTAECVQVERDGGDAFRYLFGGTGEIPVHNALDPQTRFVKLELEPYEFIVLERQPILMLR